MQVVIFCFGQKKNERTVLIVTLQTCIVKHKHKAAVAFVAFSSGKWSKKYSFYGQKCDFNRRKYFTLKCLYITKWYHYKRSQNTLLGFWHNLGGQDIQSPILMLGIDQLQKAWYVPFMAISVIALEDMSAVLLPASSKCKSHPISPCNNTSITLQ